MSAHSTLRITRSKAKDELIKSIIGEISDSALESFLDNLLDRRLYNVVIVEDSDSDNDDSIL